MVSKQKKETVLKLAEKIAHYPIVGIVNFENLPAQQLQKMRALLLKDNVEIVMIRKKLLELALDCSGKEKIEGLAEKMRGMPALIFAQSNPFTLYSIIQKNKSEAPAKGGQTTHKEIVVKAGPTNFAPGPIISELAGVGIKTKVEGGKLAIINDVIVAKEGTVISLKLAEALKRLDIKPLEIGLDLVAVWENGLIFSAKQLHLDVAEYAQKFTMAAQWALNLAVESVFLTKESTEALLQKAFREAKAVGIESAFLSEETVTEILAQIERQALSLKKEAKLGNLI